MREPIFFYFWSVNEWDFMCILCLHHQIFLILSAYIHHFYRSYKELMIQCNILGRSDTRARKKLDKSKEKINRLNVSPCVPTMLFVCFPGSSFYVSLLHAEPGKVARIGEGT